MIICFGADAYIDPDLQAVINDALRVFESLSAKDPDTDPDEEPGVDLEVLLRRLQVGEKNIDHE